MNSQTTQFKSTDVEWLVGQLNYLCSAIEQDLQKGVAIYGAGFVGLWAANYLGGVGAKVSCFIDRDPQKVGTMINGIPVIALADLENSSITSVLIGARHAIKEVTESMNAYQLNILSFDAFFVIKNYARFSGVRDHYFSDPHSVEVYNALLTAMLTGSVASCRAMMEKDMYFCLPEFSGKFDEIFVDAGAFVGDTVERFIWENLGTFKQLYAFEPGMKQYVALQKRMDRLIEEWAIDASSVHLEKAGLASEPGRMACTFVNDFPLRHGLSQDTSDTLDEVTSSNVYALDDYLAGKPVTFIKADVEGMEMALLKGAQKTIQQFKPKMALCAYHYPSDLYEIAEYVRSLVPEYQFKLRQHAPLFGDFVLYCYVV